MNNSIPDWNFISRLPGTNQVKSRGADNELVELLWQDGQVVAHSQAARKQASEQDQTSLKGTSPNETTFQDDETVSWFQYPPEDSFLKDAQKQAQVRHGVDPSSSADQMPPPKFHHPDSVQNDHKGGLGRIVNFSHFSSPVKGGLLSSNVIHRTKEAGNLTQGDARQCSGMTIGLSHCGSNQVLNDPDIGQVSKSAANNNSLSAEPIKDSKGKIMVIPHESCEMETFSATVSSSCGGSDGSSFGKASKQSIRVESLKRKGRDAEESDCQSEAEASKKSKSSHRSRAAEIHNLSEKRRRDRINKKMKALQELIPHCSKTDKASLLDEAIEYLKSLQLQLQIMWMGTGMAPMLIPGVQQYMSRLSMGIGPTPLGPISNPMHLPKVPLVDRSRSITPVLNQAVFCQPTALNHVSLPNQMQNLPFPEQYARYLGFQHAQNPSQPMNVFKLGPPPSSQSQTIAPSTSIPGLPSGGLN